jgi:hypothetical protein
MIFNIGIRTELRTEWNSLLFFQYLQQLIIEIYFSLPTKVWTYKAQEWKNGNKIVFVVHGGGRNSSKKKCPHGYP